MRSFTLFKPFIGEPFLMRDELRNYLRLRRFLNDCCQNQLGSPGHSFRSSQHLPKAFEMARWLIKSEPESYSWDDLVSDGKTEWDGVRNNAARLHLRAMKVGDEAFFYRSVVEPAIVGRVRVSRGPAPDPKDNAWVSVEVVPVGPVGPVSLKDIKAEPSLAAMELLRQSRLSVAPVRDEEWDKILAMGASR